MSAEKPSIVRGEPEKKKGTRWPRAGNGKRTNHRRKKGKKMAITAGCP